MLEIVLLPYRFCPNFWHFGAGSGFGLGFDIHYVFVFLLVSLSLLVLVPLDNNMIVIYNFILE